eukprot:14582405-Ditylum_brightwellii.AAC.1
MTKNTKNDECVTSAPSEVGRAYAPAPKPEHALYLSTGVHMGYCRSVVVQQKAYKISAVQSECTSWKVLLEAVCWWSQEVWLVRK